jgi:hypothetical protein
MRGKCPKCEKAVFSLQISATEAGEPFGTRWKALTYNCPYCNTILGCQIDPIAVKIDIVNEVLKGIKKIL